MNTFNTAYAGVLFCWRKLLCGFEQLLCPSDWTVKQVLSRACVCCLQSLGMLTFYVLTGGSHPFGDPDTRPGVCINNIMRGAWVSSWHIYFCLIGFASSR